MLFIAVDYDELLLLSFRFYLPPVPSFLFRIIYRLVINAHALHIIQGGSFDENARDAYYNNILLNIL